MASGRRSLPGSSASCPLLRLLFLMISSVLLTDFRLWPVLPGALHHAQLENSDPRAVTLHLHRMTEGATKHVPPPKIGGYLPGNYRSGVRGLKRLLPVPVYTTLRSAPKSLMPHRSQRGRVLLVWNISSRFPSHLTLVREYDPKEQGEAAMVQSVAQTNVVGVSGRENETVC